MPQTIEKSMASVHEKRDMEYRARTPKTGQRAAENRENWGHENAENLTCRDTRARSPKILAVSSRKTTLKNGAERLPKTYTAIHHGPTPSHSHCQRFSSRLHLLHRLPLKLPSTRRPSPFVPELQLVFLPPLPPPSAPFLQFPLLSLR